MVQLIGHHSTKRKVAGLIPGQGIKGSEAIPHKPGLRVEKVEEGQ